MKIISSRIYEYRLRLKQPIGPPDAPLNHRSGLLVRVASDTGYQGWGEASPLPGFSSETLADAQTQLVSVLRKIEDSCIPPDVIQLQGAFDNWLGQYDLNPSARFAIEMSVLNLLATERGPLVADLLSPEFPDTINVNGLITGTGQSAVERAKALCEQGYHTLKLKVGRATIPEEIETVQSILSVLPDDIALRLDANRAWSPEQALQFARGVEGRPIEYIEEPLADPAGLKDFCSKTDLPVALDESTREIVREDLAEWKHIAAVVLKPTLLGGFERTAEFARAASDQGARVVISSTFESPVGIAALANFAAAYGTPDVAVGLETVNWFEQQLLAEPVSICEGTMNLVQASEAAKTIDVSFLRELDTSSLPKDRKPLCPVRSSAERFPMETALIEGNRIVTFRELDIQVSSALAHLRKSGVKQGDRVAMVEENCIEYVIVLFALFRLGATACPLSHYAGVQVLVDLARTIKCTHQLTFSGSTPEKNSTEMPKVNFPRADDLLPGTEQGSDTLDLDQPITIMTTSGSTGRPKSVLHTFGNHWHSAEGSNRNMPIEPGDRWLLSLSLFHVGGLAILFRCFLFGGTAVIGRPSDNLPAEIEKHNITHISLVATQLRRLLADYAKTPHPAPPASLKAVLLGGGPVDNSLLAAAKEAGLPLYTSYGLTEMASQVCTSAPAYPEIIRPLRGRKVRISDEGEILVKGETLFKGYVEGDEVQLPVDAEGWFRTGDLGTLDDARGLTVTGRRDNMFVSGGENIHPEEIEQSLLQMDEISEAVAVPVSDQEFGLRPAVFVLFASEDATLSHAAMRERLRAQGLPGLKIPVAFLPLPRAESGPAMKADRVFLRGEAEKLLSRR